jgi:hypothetical protein
MKLPVMLEASGIKNIIIDGKIHWMRMNVDNSEWTRQLDNGRGYAYKSEEKLLKYVRHLIEHEGYDKVWVSGATINVTKVVTALVTRPEKVSPAGRLTMEYFREQYMWIEHKGI